MNRGWADAWDEDWRSGLRFMAWETSALEDLLLLSIPWMAGQA